MSSNPTGTQSTPDGPKEPSGGATVGVFFLCWLVGGFCCAIASLMCAQANGLAGYSAGGIGTFIIAICGAAYYHSSGMMGVAVLFAAIIGICIGLLIAEIARVQFLM